MPDDFVVYQQTFNMKSDLFARFHLAQYNSHLINNVKRLF